MDNDQSTEKVRLCMLSETLNDFFSFRREVQMDLVEAAIDLVFASLADSPHCSEVERYFWLMVHQTYMATGHAASSLPEDKRLRMCSEAFQKCEEFRPAFREIMIASSRALSQLGQDDFRGRLVRDLSYVRGPLIDHASAAELQELIGPCIALSRATRLFALGGAPASDVAGWAARVSSIALKIWASVEKLIKAGKLSVINGKVVKPTA